MLIYFESSFEIVFKDMKLWCNLLNSTFEKKKKKKGDKKIKECQQKNQIECVI